MDDERLTGAGRGGNRIRTVVLGLGCAGIGVAAWYVHWRQMTRIDGAHLLYVPVVLACLWFGWRGLAVAVLGGVCLILPHFIGVVSGTPLEHDILRAVVLVVVAVIVSLLRQRQITAKRQMERLRWQLEKSRETSEAEYEILDCRLKRQLADLRQLSEKAEQREVEKGLLLDAVPESVVYLDRELRVRWANRAACKRFDLTRQALMGRSFSQLQGERITSGLPHPVEEAMETGCAARREETGRDGVRWSLQGYPIADENGEVVGGVEVALDMTDAHAAEEALVRERGLLRTVIDNLPDSIFVKDRDSRFLLCNRAVLRFHDLQQSEALEGKTDFDLFPEDAAAQFYSEEQHVMNTGRPLVGQQRCRKDPVTGGLLWHMTTKLPLRNAEGQVVGLVGICTDITSYRRIQETYQCLVDHSLQGLVVIQDQRVVFANEAMAEISGYSVDEILAASARAILRFIHREDRRRVYHLHQARIQGEAVPRNHAFRATRKDGTLCWLEIHANRIQYHGSPAVQAACMDVTERVRAENALRESEAQNRAVLDAIPDLIFQVNGEGVFLDYRNTEGHEAYPRPGEFLGRTVAELLPEAVAERFMYYLGEAVETGQPQTFEYQLPAGDAVCDQECRLVRCGRRQALAIVRDITERKRAERLRDLQRDIAVELSSISGLQDGYLACLETALRSSQMDCGAIYTIDRDIGGFQLVAHSGLSEEYVRSVQQMPADSGAGRLAMAGESAYGNHSQLGVRLSPVQRREGLRATAILPVKRKGRVIACMICASHTREVVSEWSCMVLDMIAAQIGSTVGRLRAEEALRREHRLVSRITDTSPAGIMLVDCQGRYVFANACAERILGLTKEQITERRYNALEWGIADYEGQPLPDEALPFAVVLATGKPVYDVRHAVQRPDGTRVLLRVNAAPLLDESGRMEGMVAAIEDVTERVLAERSLRESEERFRQIFENTMLGLYRTTPDGRVLMANPALVRMLGFTSLEELTRRDVVDGYAPGESRDSFKDRIEADGQVVGYEAVWRRRDGEALYVCEHARVVRDASGQTLYYEGTVEDVTERKQAEERLRYRLDYEELVATISSDFVNLNVDEIDGGIDRTLERLSAFVGVDRCFVALLDDSGKEFNAVYEWCAEGIESTRDYLKAIDVEAYGDAYGRLVRAGSFNVPCVSDLQGPEADIRETIEAVAVKSSLCVPVAIGGAVHGLLGFAMVVRERVWSDDEVSLVQTVAEVFANALERKRSADALSERLAHETLLSDLSAAFINLPVERIDEEIEQGIRRIATVLEIDRGEVMQLSKDGLDARVTHSWAAEGLERAPLGLLKDQEVKTWGLECLRRGELAVFSRVDDVADMSDEEKAHWRREGVKSGVVIPITVAGRTLGGVAFASVRKERVWSNELVQRLRLMGEIFANALLRKRSEEILIASERNYREIFNAANDATFVHDPATGAIVDVNDATLDMFGYSYDALIRLDSGSLRYGDAAQAQEELQQLLLRTTEEGPQVAEWLCRRKDGSCFYAEVNLKQASIGGQPRVLAVVRDISERKQAEKAAELHRAELARAWHVNALGEMASGLAHELNQPLCAILNYANGCLRLARKRELPKAALRESIKEVIGQAERAGDIVKRVRGLVGKREPHCVKLDVKALLNDAMDMIEKEAAKHDVKVVPEFKGRLPKVHADDVEIEQVAMNLMRNAIEAMGDEQVAERTLTISASRPKKETVEVAIKDTGRGLSPELSEQVFNSFFTTKEHGLGIGLSLSRRIVEAHGGRLWVESDGSSGTTFRFTLPVVGAANGTRRARSIHRRR